MTEHHKQWVGKVFDCAASQYGEGSCSFFNYFGKQLVEHVPVAAKWQALDIATGKGAVLFPLAERVGHSGKVVGVDISKQMLAETSIAVQKRDKVPNLFQNLLPKFCCSRLLNEFFLRYFHQVLPKFDL